MTYNINKIKDRYATMTGEKKADNKDKWKKPYTEWKPTLTEEGKLKKYNVRLMPYEDQNGNPFQEIAFYDSKEVSNFKLEAPVQFGLPDPINEFVTTARSKKLPKEEWMLLKPLFTKSRFFAPVLVREEADKGVQVWEFGPTVCKDIFTILTSEDYVEEQLNDPNTGRDFEVTVLPTDKKFKNPTNGKEYPVNEIKIMARGKSTKLALTEKEIKVLVDSIPKLNDYYKSRCKSEDDLEFLLESYLASTKTSNDPINVSVPETTTSVSVGAKISTGGGSSKSTSSALSEAEAEAMANIAAGFSDLEE